MTRSRHALLVAASLLAATLATLVQTQPPAAVPASTPTTEFSAERAVEHIRVIAQQPRPTGSAANVAARQYILAVLKDLGLETQTQPEGNLENVVARLAGTRSSEAVLLTAHLDSVAAGPGATDDGSGIAVLLETARGLASAERLPNTVMFLFTDLEEGGSVGAQAFIAHHPWARDVRLVVGFDAGGLSGPGVLSATSASNGWLIRQLAQADPYLSGSSAVNALADSGTDFGHAFKPAGFSGYAFDLYWDRHIHTPEDNLASVSLSSLQHQGYHALSLARHFGQSIPLTDPKEPDAVYFSVLRLFTVVYPSIWVIPLAVAVSLFFFGVLAFGLSRGMLTWGGMAYGALVLFIAIIIAPVPSLPLDRSMLGLPFRFIGRALNQAPQVATVVLASIGLIVLWYALSQRFKRTSTHDLTMGALGLLCVGMLGTALAFPALSFALTWPLCLSLAACAIWFYSYAMPKGSIVVMVCQLASGAASVVVLGPTILLGLFDQMVLTLLLVGVLCGFLVPQIHLLLGRNTQA